jgi:hypothetical protein
MRAFRQRAVVMAALVLVALLIAPVSAAKPPGAAYHVCAANGAATVENLNRQSPVQWRWGMHATGTCGAGNFVPAAAYTLAADDIYFGFGPGDPRPPDVLPPMSAYQTATTPASGAIRRSSQLWVPPAEGVTVPAVFSEGITVVPFAIFRATFHPGGGVTRHGRDGEAIVVLDWTRATHECNEDETGCNFEVYTVPASITVFTALP